MKTRLMIVIGMILPSVFFPAPALASCAAPTTGAEFFNFEKASTVFVGTVTDIYNPHPEIHTGTEEYDTITFDVVRVLKGDAGDGTVRSGHDSAGYRGFEVGKTYLVYAFSPVREVSQCTPPKLLSGDSALTIHDAGLYLPYILIGIAAAVPSIIVWRRYRR